MSDEPMSLRNAADDEPIAVDLGDESIGAFEKWHELGSVEQISSEKRRLDMAFEAGRQDEHEKGYDTGWNAALDAAIEELEFAEPGEFRDALEGLKAGE